MKASFDKIEMQILEVLLSNSQDILNFYCVKNKNIKDIIWYKIMFLGICTQKSSK